MDVFFTAVLLLTFTIQAQAPSVLWAKEYGGSTWCYGESVAQTDDGGFIVAGYKEVFKRVRDNKEDFDRIYVVRTDSNGDTLWTKGYGGEGAKAYSIQKTKDGGFVIAGLTMASEFNMDTYLIRIDSIGDTLWTRTHGTEGDSSDGEKAYSINTTHEGGFILAGETSLIDPPGPSAYLVRTDSAGDTLWTKTYAFGGETSSYAKSIIQTDSGGFAFTGHLSGGRGFFIRTDSSGKLLIKKTFTLQSLNANGVVLRDLKQTSDGGFILVGQISRPLGYDPGVLLIRTDPNGDTLWTKVYTEGQRGYSVDITEDEGFIVSSASGMEALIIRTDSNGDSLWSINSKEFEWEGWLKSIKQTADGGFIAAGKGTVDTTGVVDVVLVRIDKEGTLIQKEENNQQSTIKGFTLFGNYKDKVIYTNYTIPNSCNVRLEVYDTLGKMVKVLVDKYQNSGPHTLKWKPKRGRRKLAAGGVYFLKLSADGHTVSKKVTIVK